MNDAVKDTGAFELMRKNLLGFDVTISVVDSGMNTADPSVASRQIRSI